MARRPADPEEELRWMAQEVRGYVEAVLNSLAANVPKVSSILVCQFSFFCFLLRFQVFVYQKKVFILSIVFEQAVVLCQVEKAKEDMLNQLYSSIRLASYLIPWQYKL